MDPIILAEDGRGMGHSLGPLVCGVSGSLRAGDTPPPQLFLLQS